MPGWFGYAPSGEEGPPPDPAYSRVTNPERFRPLHTAMHEIISRLENDFEVERAEGYGLDQELESHPQRAGLDLASPSVRLNPNNPDAAPIVVAFSTFPSLNVRFGRWYMEPFPDCGCDACATAGESVERESERLNDMVDDVTSGRFREAIYRPRISFQGSAWRETRFWAPVGSERSSTRSISRSRIDGVSAHRMSGGRRRLALDWKPWPRRPAAG